MILSVYLSAQKDVGWGAGTGIESIARGVIFLLYLLLLSAGLWVIPLT